MKVYEFAKTNGIETLELMDKIRKWKDLKIKSHMATLDESTMDEIYKRLREEKKLKKKKKASTKGKEPKPIKKAKKEATSQSVKDPSKPKAKRKVQKKTKEDGKKGEVKKEESLETKTSHLKKKKISLAHQSETLEKKTPAKKKRNIIRRAAFHSPQTAQKNIQPPQDLKKPPLFSPLKDETSEKKEQKLKIEAEMQKTLNLENGTEVATLAPTPTQEEEKEKSSLKKKEKEHLSSEDTSLEKEKSNEAHSTQKTNAFVSKNVLSNIKTFFPEEIKKDERKKKQLSNEAALKNFSASDFKKREIIFQPKRKKLVSSKEGKKNIITTPSSHKRVVKMNQSIPVKNLGMQLNIQVKQLVKKLSKEGIEADLNSHLDYETVSLIAQEYGFETQNLYRPVHELLESARFGDLKALPILRTPIVTVMGHVDHGKTTLLDVIRNTNAVKKEAGGITQHIGAYSVSLSNKKQITFIDTPGHEAFTAMRARGSHLTDIVVLVVAADDGVMPQTIEAIRHAQAAKAPIIVAMNKSDLSNANPENIKQQLAKYDLIPEEWGGSTMFCEVSALKRKGIDQLLEQIYLLSEMQDLKANPKCSALGVVLESSQKKGFGNVATVLIKDGTLKKGDVYLAGSTVGRVRNMMNDRGQKVQESGPGMPVEILGVPEKLEAGDSFHVCQNENLAQAIAIQVKNEIKEKKTKNKTSDTSVEDLFSKLSAKESEQRISFIIKSDVSGSSEAIEAILSKLDVKDVKVEVIHSGLGAINESDVLLASTTKSLILGFNVRPDVKAQKLSHQKSVEIRTYNVIYDLVDDIKKLMIQKIKPDIIEESKGRLQVREVFHISKVGAIAGCFVTEGSIARNHSLRLLREGRMIYEGRISSLKRFKEDIKEVKNNLECGVGIENFNDVKVGDEIESFINKEVRNEDIFSKNKTSNPS